MISRAASADQKILLTPKSGFVVKSRLEKPTVSPIRQVHTKVFINICSNQNVPLPQHHNESFQPEIIYPLIVNNQWEIPIITSNEKQDKDNRGQLSYVYDCFINDRCMSWVHLYKELREIVVEWCLESVEIRFGVCLDRDVLKFPKLSYKGQFTCLEVLKKDLDARSFEHQRQEIERLVTELDHLLLLDELGNSKSQDNSADSSISIFGNSSANKAIGKSLIEEINSPTTQINDKSPVSEVKGDTKPKEKLNFELQFVNLKDQSRGYKLLVYVKSAITSQHDYSLSYNTATQSLLLKVVNPQYETKRGVFEIPLPSFVLKQTNGKFKAFFEKESNKLAIFV